MHHDPHWPRAHTWLNHSVQSGGIAVLGVPLNNSLSPGACDQAPAAIRVALSSFSPYDVEHDLDLFDLPCQDLGDVEVESHEDALQHLESAVRGCSEEPSAWIFLGGDNGVTRPGVHAIGSAPDRIGLLTLDAHFDLRSLESGPNNGNPIRGLLEDGVPGENIVQIGVQAFANSATYAGVAREAGIQVVTNQDVHERTIELVILDALEYLQRRVDAVYVDLDLDVMDRGWCPGSPGARPGGLLPWHVRRAAYLVGRDPLVRAMDVVELDPQRDTNQATAMVAAASVLSFAAGVLSR